MHRQEQKMDNKTPAGVLKKVYGYDSFRGRQEQLIESLLDGRDLLAVMPTGAGKSICYQIPALMKEGITLVVSPLISLMHDQVMNLVSLGVPAAYLNSSLNSNQIRQVMRNILAGRYKIVYIAPERLLSPSFLSLCSKVPISMVAVDEAHCISSWGQNFRPHYLDIPSFIDRLPERPVVAAFTATATARVREDIQNLLRLRNPVTSVSGFDRPNLHFSVDTPASKDVRLCQFLQGHKDESGLVYCLTRAKTEEVAEMLRSKGFKAAAYHAGLPAEERKKIQDDFLYDRISVLVATNAFGMGIDKSSIRYVVHYSMPQSIENYYQEAGRAGRDGLPSECLLMADYDDFETNRFLIEQPRNMDSEMLSEEQIEMARRMDYARLYAMKGYTETEGCLRTYILQYFGESVTGQCANCSNCDAGYQLLDFTRLSYAILQIVMTLPAHYALGTLRDFLKGSSAKKILDRGLNEYKGYGLFKNQTFSQITRYLEMLCTAGYLVRSPDKYQTIQPAQKLISAYKNKETVMIPVRNALPAASSKKKAALNLELTKEENDLLLWLKKVRLARSMKDKVPPYIVFNDRILQQMAREQPDSKEALMKISGIGEKKTESYGELFLKAIRDWKEHHKKETGR